MPDYIFTSKEEITDIVKEAVSEIFSIKQSQKSEIDSMDIDSLLRLLSEYGYKITKSQVYKLTSSNHIPYMKLGGRLIFSRKEVTNWLTMKSKRPINKDELYIEMQKHLRESPKLKHNNIK